MGINLGSWANCLLEPFYSSEEVEDLDALKGGTPRRKGLESLKGWSKTVGVLRRKALPHSKAPGTAASNGVLANLDDGRI